MIGSSSCDLLHGVYVLNFDSMIDAKVRWKIKLINIGSDFPQDYNVYHIASLRLLVETF